MKTQFYKVLPIVILGMLGCCELNTAYSQATVTPNNITTSDYLGSSNNFNVVFKENGIQRMVLDTTGDFGVATTLPMSVLSVGGNGASNDEAYIDQTSNANNATGLDVIAPQPGSGNHVYAITGHTISGGGGYSYGVNASADAGTTDTNTGRAYGVYGSAARATSGYNYGVYGLIEGGSTKRGAGVFGTDGQEGYGDFNTNVSWAGFFKGRLFADSMQIGGTPGYVLNATGIVLNVQGGASKPGGGTWTTPSDRRLKTNINKFSDGLNVLRQINPVTYNYNGIGGLPKDEPQIGIIAQDIQRAAPYCVSTGKMIMNEGDASKFDHVQKLEGTDKFVAQICNYNMNGLIYVMINSIKELDNTVDSLRNVLKAADIGTTMDITNAQNVVLSSADAPVLYQNSPNPFGSGGTKINYFIPAGTVGATLVFYDSYGNQIKEMQLNQTGNASINVTTDKLNAGIYSYSLIINGQLIDTKKMLFTK